MTFQTKYKKNINTFSTVRVQNDGVTFLNIDINYAVYVYDAGK